MQNKLSGLAAAALVAGASPAFAGDTPFWGEINVFGGYYCPVGWVPADGRSLPIQTNQNLFQLLGTTYGGDGATNFAVPDLRGRLVVGAGQGPGLANYQIAQSGGAESVALTAQQIPSHTHGVAGIGTPPSAQVRSGQFAGVAIVRSSAAGPTASTSNAGAGEPHENRQPYLATTICIANTGLFPSRQ